MNFEYNLESDLRCPLTTELLEDPVMVPCCSQPYSRQALIRWLDTSPNRDCPKCRGDLSNFDAQTVATNTYVVSLVDNFRNRPREVKAHRWTCEIYPVKDTGIGEMKLTVEDAKFQTRPTLFIAVVDRSGSMRGNPWKQVETALIHIMGLKQYNPNVKVVVIAYESYAEIIDVSGSSEEVNQKIKTMFTGGGTNFRNAFHKIREVLSGYACGEEIGRHNISNVTIAFMTDGLDGSGARHRLAPEFREMLQECWTSRGYPLSVHTVGFGQCCDRELLEAMRTEEGTFRYAEPNDDADTLCHKLTEVFEICSQGSSVELELKMNGFSPLTPSTRTRISINSRSYGEIRQWVRLDNPRDITINSSVDRQTRVNILQVRSEFVFQRWLSKLTDDLASQLLEVSKGELSQDLKELWCAILAQRANAIYSHSHDESVNSRLEYLLTQIDNLKEGVMINVGKVSDLRFASLFGERPQSKPEIRAYVPQVPRIDDKPYFEMPLKRYSRNNQNKDRNSFQEAITRQPYNALNDELKGFLASVTLSEILHRDVDGNNALMLASYCGQSELVKVLLTKFNIDLELTNNDGETATTLAIKKRGFHMTLLALMNAGASIPRKKALERFAISHGYTITAQILANNSMDVDETMTPEYVEVVYQNAKEQGKLNSNFLKVALAKGLIGMTRELLKLGYIPTIDMLLDYCIPRKPDSPETPHYLELATLVLEANPDLIHQRRAPELNSALIEASQRGSLPHVEYFLSLGAEIEQTNEKGNTALWVACFMRYPCIITALLDRGANINHANLKGNPCLYGPCCRGNVKVAEMLLARGADVTHINSNGDTLILICCRNGQHEVLKFLLNYVDENFVNFKAHIDGFNAIMASAEQNKPECIRVLFEYGINLNQKTDHDNAILAEATPLHIASYYGRVEAVKKLLELGANANEVEKHGQTALHIAVIQGHTTIIKLLSSFCDLNLRDRSGNTAVAYCRNRPEIRKSLVNPALDILMKLARNGFSPEDEREACRILREHTGVIGCLTPTQAIEIQDTTGTSVLTQATIHSNYNVVKVLRELDACPFLMNAQEMTAEIWAKWINNPRIKRLIGDDMGKFKIPRVLFLGQPPPYSEYPPESGLTVRMEDYVNTPCELEESFLQDLLRIQSNSVRYVEEKKLDNPNLLWNAKVFSVGAYIQGTGLTPEEILSVCMFTNNPSLCSLINASILQRDFSSTLLRDYIGVLISALRKIPKYRGEVFLGGDIDRTLFPKGHQFVWPRFTSGSTLWRVALENTPSFTSKARKGTIVIIKSKTGRLVSGYSQYSFDSEVIFLPYAQFRVTGWYHGDVIALGQENIREHTFGIKERDDERMCLEEMTKSDKSLIIELTEI